MSDPNPDLPRPEIPNHEILKWIGGGSYGEVWLACNIMGVCRAVKVVRKANFDSSRPYEREFEGLRIFEPVSRASDGFTDILQIGRNDSAGYFFYVMEVADDQVSGQKIDPKTYRPKTLATEFAIKGRLQFQESLRIALSLCEAVRYLHERGLVHRDIKPSNIIFVNDLPKLADIGLVTSSTDAATFLGAPGYIAPEGPGKPQADIYSLGKVLYEISTGNDRLEFPKPPLHIPDEEIPEFQELNEIVLKACESDPRRRYENAERMQSEILLLRGGKSVRRLRLLEQTWVKAKRIVAVCALLGIAAILFQSVSLIQQRREKDVFQLLLLRSSEHQNGWFSNAWNHSKFAKNRSLFGNKEALRDQTAALLAGADAYPLDCFSNSKATAVAFDASGERLLLSGFDEEPAKLVGCEMAEITLGPSASFSAPLGFSQSDEPSQLVFDVDNKQVLLINPITGRTNQIWFVPSEVQHVMLGSWSNILAALSKNGASGVAAVQTKSGANALVTFGTTNADLIGPFSNSISAVAISSEGEMITAAEARGDIHVWSTSNQREIDRFSPGRNEVISLALKGIPFSTERNSKAGKKWLVASGDAGGNATLWEVGSHSAKSRFSSGEAQIFAVAFSPDGTILASGGRGTLKLWDATNEQLLLSIGAGDYIKGLDFASSGNRLAVAHEATTYPIGWDLEWDRGIKTLRGLSGRISKLCISANGKLLAAFSHDWEAAVWEVRTGRRLMTIEIPRGVYYDNAALALSPDDKYLIFSTSTTAKMWDITTGNSVTSWTLPQGWADTLAFSCEDTAMLFRCESRNLNESVPESLSLSDERVCRIRKLNVHDEENTMPRVAKVISDFRSVYNVAATGDGKYFIVEGAPVGTNIHSHLIASYESETGARIWSKMSNEQGIYAPMAAEGAGDAVAVRTNHSQNMVLIHAASGIVSSTFPSMLSASASSANCYVDLTDDGRALWCNNPRRRLMSFLNNPDASPPKFDASGNLCAWGNTDGTVTVCNLPEIRRRLNQLRMGW